VFELRKELNYERPGGYQDFVNGKGCPCCHWGADAPEERPEVCEAMQVCVSLMGDDLDGCASTLEDLCF
jgi:hypothetical protein